MRERSVARLPHPEAELPTRPTYNQTLEDAYHSNRANPWEESWNNIISRGSGHYDILDRMSSPYDKAMDVYSELVRKACYPSDGRVKL